MSISRVFRSDRTRYEGVRPINIYLLRLTYLLIVVVGSDAWISIVSHEGPWDHLRALALCAGATYSTIAILGVIQPLTFLPIMFLVIGHVALWLVVVAYPLWRDGTLAGSPAEAMAKVFLWIPLAMIAVPWKYAFRTYVMWRRSGVSG